MCITKINLPVWHLRSSPQAQAPYAEKKKQLQLETRCVPYAMASLRTKQDSSSSDDDEDFGPLLPPVAAAPPPQLPQPATDQELAQSRKRERPESGEETKEAAQQSPNAAPTTSTAPTRAEARALTPEERWANYRRQQLPSAALYERSYLHTALQDAHDAFTAAASSGCSPVAANVHPVHDVCLHLDTLGALIATIDAAGVVRVWRKLPRGLFFITELDKVFPPSEQPCSRHYWAHAFAALQLLVFVCVEEEEVVLDAGDASLAGDSGSGGVPGPSATSSRTVRVYLRQVNPVTFTVEERDSFTFQAPVQRAVSVMDVSEKSTHTPASPAQWRGPPAMLALTRQPAFLTHRYAPHIAFFVSLSSPTSGGNGVVLCPCFSAQAARGGGGRPVKSSSSTTGEAVGPHQRRCVPTRVSVANPIVACVQQVVGLERAGTAACVLLDAAGVVDYATIELDTPAGGGAGREGVEDGGTALTLKVMAGLAAVPPASREARVWRQWIRFERRQRTGFFSLVRDAQQARKEAQSAASAAAAAVDVQVLPCAVQLTPDGRHVVVSSLRLTRTPVTATAASMTSRIPSAVRHHDVRVDSCLHVLDFASGALLATHAEPVGAFRTSEDFAFPPAEWSAFVQLRSRATAARCHVEASAAVAGESSGAGRFYVLVPEVPLDALLGLTSTDLSVANAGAAQSGGPRSQVAGRVVRVYEVAGEAPAASAPSWAVLRLPHSPGEWEAAVQRLPDAAPPSPPPHALQQQLSGAGEGGGGLAVRLRSPAEYGAPSITASSIGHGGGSQPPRLALCRAPLLLLRRAVAPSQDLKNLVAASPVGAALSAETRKHLFAHPTQSSDSGAGGVGEAVLLTSSADAAGAALLVYSGEMPWGSAAVARVLLANASVALESAADGEPRQPHPEDAETWAAALSELHRSRDDACGTLLLATIAPQSTPVTAAAGGAQPLAVQAAVTDEAGGSSGSSAAPNTAVVRRAEPVTDEEATVRTLLSGVLPVDAAKPAPVVLVHVRGYGTIRVHLLPSIAPLAVDNFVRLARRRYYDRQTFHRVLPGAIVQGGCPRGDGAGGESAFTGGAAFRDESVDVFPFFSHTGNSRCCWLCMANAGPDTNQSQFFFTVPGGEAMPWLNGHHTVFGYAVEGLGVVRAMSLAARDDEDKPLSPILMERVDVLSGTA